MGGVHSSSGGCDIGYGSAVDFRDEGGVFVE